MSRLEAALSRRGDWQLRGLMAVVAVAMLLLLALTWRHTLWNVASFPVYLTGWWLVIRLGVELGLRRR